MTDLTTDLAAWRKARGRVGVQELPEAMPPGTPFTLVVDYSGLSALVGTDQVKHTVLDAALEGLTQAQQAYATYQEQPEGQGQHLLTVQLNLEKSLAAYHDVWLSAFIVSPPYYPLDQVPRGACPADGICLYDIPAERRQPLVDLARGGFAALESFCAAIREQDALGDGEDAGPETVELATPSDPAGGVPAGRGALRPLGTGGSGPPASPGHRAAGAAGPPPARRTTRRAG